MAINFMLGGASANELHAGSFTVGGDATWANSQGAGGAPLFSADNITSDEITDNGTTVTITRTGISTDVAVGHWAYADWDGGTFVDERYRVSARDGGSVTLDFGGDAGNKPPAGGGNDTTKLRIGGAVKQGGSNTTTHLQLLLDAAVAGDSLKLQGDLTIASQLNINQNAGSYASRITVEGVDAATGVRLGRDDVLPTITASASMTAIFFISAKNSWDWARLDLNGGGAGKADNGIYTSTICNYHRFLGLKLHNFDLLGLRWSGASYCLIFDCEVYDNRSFGGVFWFSARSAIIGLNVHDNIGYGLEISSYGNTIEYVLSADNSVNGIDVAAAGLQATLAHCTCVGNGGDGIDVHASATDSFIFNVSSCNNGGYGFKLGTIDRVSCFGGNHANGNATSETDVSGTWADIGQGGNTNADPDFVDAGNDNYTIGNADVSQSGILDNRGEPTSIGAAAISLTCIESTETTFRMRRIP